MNLISGSERRCWYLITCEVREKRASLYYLTEKKRIFLLNDSERNVRSISRLITKGAQSITQVLISSPGIIISKKNNSLRIIFFSQSLNLISVVLATKSVWISARRYDLSRQSVAYHGKAYYMRLKLRIVSSGVWRRRRRTILFEKRNWTQNTDKRATSLCVSLILSVTLDKQKYTSTNSPRILYKQNLLRAYALRDADVGQALHERRGLRWWVGSRSQKKTGRGLMSLLLLLLLLGLLFELLLLEFPRISR